MHRDARLHARGHWRPVLCADVEAPQLATSGSRAELEAPGAVPFDPVIVADGDHVEAIVANLAAVEIDLKTIACFDFRVTQRRMRLDHLQAEEVAKIGRGGDPFNGVSRNAAGSRWRGA